MTDAFSYYPEVDQEDYAARIYKKKEFYDQRFPDDYYAIIKGVVDVPIDPIKQRKEKAEYLEKNCDPSFFKLQNYQIFVRNYLSPPTPYRGLLVFHGVGAGKTCSAVQIAEGFKDDVWRTGHKINVIASKTLQENFQKNLYNITKEDPDIPPGQNQCTGITYYQPPIINEDQKKRVDRIQREQKRYYNFITNLLFERAFNNEFGTQNDDGTWSYPDFDTDARARYRLQQLYDNTVYIIDEAQNLIPQSGSRGNKQIARPKAQANAVAGENEDEATFGGENEAGESEATQAGENADTEGDENEDNEDEAVATGDAAVVNQEKEEREDKAAAERIYNTFLNYILKYTDNVRIVLLTATPMRNSPDDLVELVNLLRMNDYKSYDALIKLNPSGGDDYFRKWKTTSGKKPDIDNPLAPSEAYNKEYLQKNIQGYVSYIRGENPLIFPRKEIVWNYLARPILDYYQHDIEMNLVRTRDEKHIPSIVLPDRFRDPYFRAYRPDFPLVVGSWMPPMPTKLIACPMSLFQYGSYCLAETKGNQQMTQIALIAFPKEKNKVFTSAGCPIELADKSKSSNVFNYKPNRVNTYAYKTATCLLLARENIGLYSSKYSRLLEDIINPKEGRGTHFVYTRLVGESAVLIGLMLEQNGFMPYHKASDKTSPRLFSDAGVIHAKIGQKKRCWCGRLFNEHNIEKHSPKQATYIIDTGTEKLKAGPADRVKFNSLDNQNGKIIKVIIATKAGAIGLDYKNIRHMHIMDPWHNAAEIDQAIGRAIRQCSHAGLSQDEQYVKVYQYVATIPKFEEWSQIFPPKPDVVSASGENETAEDGENETEGSENENQTRMDPNLIKHWNKIFTELMGKFNALAKTRKDIDPISEPGLIPMRETEDEREYRRSYVKDRYIKYIERASKEVAIDCSLSYNYNVFPSDQDPINIKSRDLEYEDSVFKCKQSFDVIPSDDLLDLDTFKSHRYFILPILRELQNNIISLYRENFVLDLDTIEALVFGGNPDLARNLPKEVRRQYLHLALDDLLGGPRRAPINVMDQYQRPGFLIYRDPYYVFHPKDILDTRLPMTYREAREWSLPSPELKVDPELAKAQTAAPGVPTPGVAVGAAVAPTLGTTEVITRFLENLWHDYQNEKKFGELRAQYFLENYLDMLPLNSKVAYSTPAVNQRAIVEHIIENSSHETNTGNLFKLILDHYHKNLMLVKLENTYYHGFDASGGITFWDNSNWLQRIPTDQLKKLANRSVLENTQIFKKTLGKLPEQFKLSRYNNLEPKFSDMMGLIHNDPNKKQISFKILDRTNDANAKDKREKGHGMVCTSCKASVLRIKLMYLINKGQAIAPDITNALLEEYNIESLQNSLMCQLFNYLSRALDSKSDDEFYYLNSQEYRDLDLKKNLLTGNPFLVNYTNQHRT